MTLLAGTLAGNSHNQDRYMVGEGFAVVLDGATSVAGDRSHDPGWFAGRIGEVLARTLPGGEPIPDLVAGAIAEVRDADQLVPETSPTCTVTVARWSGDAVETYALCDSTIAVLHRDGTESVYFDDEVGDAVSQKREEYRARLARGHGYDEAHRDLLIELQKEQARWRNRPGGYYVAGTDPDAAYHGVVGTVERTAVTALLLATDGVDPVRHPRAETWWDLYTEAVDHGPDRVLHDLHAAEAADPDGLQWARSKRHDDKTLVVVPLT
ncbi:protein phosphatase 2C domain-containing protein [Promicromonospora vindobonensis]|uniref:Protein phosphatase 2C domain-containing protein n=1 Tax=Promicromonospora vindobonensis TaxID=195748 RepID=A0ABW5VVN2_9MICO